jgi:hypothetical protein
VKALFVRQWQTVRWLRFVLVVLMVWFVGTALIAPHLNPVLRFIGKRDAEMLSLMSAGLNQVAYAKSVIAEHVEERERWPEDIQKWADVEPDSAFALDTSEPWVLKANASQRFSSATGIRGEILRFQYDRQTRRWRCESAETALPARWVPYICQSPEGGWTRTQWLLLVVGVLLAVLLATLVWLFHRNPMLAPLQREPRRIREVPLDDMYALDQALGWLRRRAAVLRAADVAPEAWRQALAFDRALPEQKAQILALSFGAHVHRSHEWPLPGDTFEWRLPDALPVNLARCMLYLPEPTRSPAEIVRSLRDLQSGHDVLLVLSPGHDFDRALLQCSRDPANLLVTLDRRTQTRWLLDAEPADVLVQTMARQLQVSRISPYQTRGGVSRPSSFFGRDHLLARVVNREPGNYVLVGGRQLGKTSLMKAIQRRFDDHPRVRCLYLALRDHRLAPRIATEAGLDADADLETALAALVRQADGRTLLLLIDEADPFIRHDADRSYVELAQLRALSEEGRCHFMLAGFWEVYLAATHDYQSPLRNFGEVISIGGLEVEACRALATRPLERLGLAFQTPALVDALVLESGHRANLVAILCQECLQSLPMGATRIRHEQLQAALTSQAAQDAVSGWAHLTQDTSAARLDRIIVYRIAQTGAQRLTDLLALLDAHDVHCDIEHLRQALARLRLAWVLLQDGDHYRFAVPLFERQFDQAELTLFLERELRAAARVD